MGLLVSRAVTAAALGAGKCRGVIPRRLPRGAALCAPSPGLGWPVTGRTSECVCVCVYGGVGGRPQEEPSAPLPPRWVTPSPVGGGSKASSHRLVGNGLGTPVASSHPGYWQRGGREKKEPQCTQPATPHQGPPKSGPDLAPRPQVQFPPAGDGADSGLRAGGGREKFLFLLPRCPPGEAASLLTLWGSPRLCPTPTVGGGAEEGRRVCARGRRWGRGERRRPPLVP